MSFDHALGIGLVLAGHHLVEQQDRRRGGERAGDFQALQVADGKRPGLAIPDVVETDQFGDAQRHGAGVLDFRVAQEGADHDVLEHAQLAEGLHDLERAADAEPGETVSADVGECRRPSLPIDLDRAGIRPQEAREEGEDGGLAGAVRADHAENLAAKERERNIVGGDEPAEALDQVAGDEHGFAGFAARYRAAPAPPRRIAACRRPAGVDER